MKIDNYAVQMNAQYYNLQLQATKASISSDVQEFQNEDSLSVTQLDLESSKVDIDKGLSVELSKAILQNISTESRRLVRDKVEITQTSAESQALNFSVDAKVVADGREIDLSLDVSLSRSFIQTTKMSVDLVQQTLKDPLVISLNGTMPSLSTQKFSFDIDSDGTSDQISKLQSGNGFLALDKNANGVIDDGSELFGTKSGDGFADLSKYDDDQNGWIDENDKIFDKLRVWQKTDAKDELLALGEVGIGAIFLGNTQTPFSLKSNSNELLGEIRKSGFVLFENATAGVMSHVDLAVTTKENLTALEIVQKNITSQDIGKIYANNQKENNTESEDDSALQVLQKKIRALEAKLPQARDEEKASIQVQIGVLLTRMMSLLDA